MLKRLYLRFRSPKIFLIALTTFIISSLYMHYSRHYDPDWGGTNLSLSIEASVASAVITVAAEETIKLLREILEIVKIIREFMEKQEERDRAQEKTLRGVLLIAEVLRDELLEKEKQK